MLTAHAVGCLRVSYARQRTPSTAFYGALRSISLIVNASKLRVLWFGSYAHTASASTPSTAMAGSVVMAARGFTSPTCRPEVKYRPNKMSDQFARVFAMAAEQINHPQHYGGDTTYEAIKVIEAWGLGFCLGNTVKYISRAGRKDATKTVEDLEKARWYLDREIARLKKGT